MAKRKLLVSSGICELIPVGGEHLRIQLKNGEPIVIGRGPLTAISDRKCPREQIEVTAVDERKEVIVKQIGKTPSQVNGKLLQQGNCSSFGKTGWFELLQGKYKYNVHFPDSISVSGSKDKTGDEKSDEDYLKEPPAKKMKRGGLQTTLKGMDSAGPGGSDSGPKESKWREVDSLLVFQYGPAVHSTKVASFDVDNTIIETSSGKKFATGPTDWKFMSQVTGKLKSLAKEGFKIIFITNQLGISKGKPTKQEFKKKTEDIASKLDVPLLVLASTTKDIYRKPCTGMWEHLLQHENGSVEIDMKSSFYVGDAAGREVGWLPGKKKDFSCADRKFASNLQIKFLTPEEIFFNHQSTKKYNWGEFNPTSLDYSKMVPTSVRIPGSGQELVVFVGCPASGKSNFFKRFMEPKGYRYVNRDTLGSWQKCVAKSKEYLKAGASVVVDNTNPDRESRSRYTEVGNALKIPMRCFRFMTSIAHAKHNNRFRELTVTEDDKHNKVNDIVFNMYKSKFTEPSSDEGFSEIAKIDFVPTFADKTREKLYKQFLE